MGKMKEFVIELDNILVDVEYLAVKYNLTVEAVIDYMKDRVTHHN